MEGVDFIDTEGADVLKKLAKADAVQGDRPASCPGQAERRAGART